MKLVENKRSVVWSISWINPAAGGGYRRYPWLMKPAGNKRSPTHAGQSLSGLRLKILTYTCL